MGSCAREGAPGSEMEVKSAFSPVASTLGMPPDFRIEDLLDFSNDDFSSEDIAAPIGGDDAFQLPSLDSSTVTGKATATTGCCTNNSNNNDQTHDIANTGISTGPGVPLTGVKREAPLDEHPGDSLCVPCDDLDQLEWLSKFVEDSFSMGGETPRKGDGGMMEDYSVMGDHMPFESSYESSCKGFFQSTSPVSVLDSSSASSGGVLTAGNGGGGGGGGGLVNNGSNKAAAAMGEKRSSGDEHSPQQQQNQSHLLRELSVPARARSKRSRTGGRVWGNSRILESPAATASATSTDTESLSSDSNVEISGGSNNDEAPLQNSSCSSLSADSGHEFRQLQLQQHQLLLMMTPPPKAVTTVKKPWKPGKSGNSSKKLLLADAGGGADGGAPAATSAQTSWRCLHCATQRTPQWRAGPMGPKTLCNACGVRYKSGRLLPEYRPAGSPGYVGHKHSNSHKKILEMRRIKETSAPSSSPPPPAPAPAHTPAPSTVTSLLPAPYPYNATSSSGSGSLPVSGVESPTGGISPSLTS